jgi:hypothetical protein
MLCMVPSFGFMQPDRESVGYLLLPDSWERDDVNDDDAVSC